MRSPVMPRVLGELTSLDQWSLLAGLRFVLAAIVALTHLAAFASLGFFAFVPRFGAFEAVLGFLLISGYSVTVSYLKEPERFLWRRFQRIYPTYLVGMVITLLILKFAAHQPAPSPGALLCNALFLNQLFTNSSIVQPAWSLSLEFWLYCLAPALLMVRPAWTRVFVYVSFASFLLYTAARTLLHLPYFAGVGYGGNLLFLSFIWICGLRLARDPENPGPVLWDIRLIFAGHIAFDAAIQLMAQIKHHAVAVFFYGDTRNFAMQAATLWLVYFVFSRYVVVPRAARQRSQVLRFLGDISYPLYLLNITLFILLAAVGLKGAGIYFLLVLLASAALYWSVDGYSKRRHLKIRTA